MDEKKNVKGPKRPAPPPINSAPEASGSPNAESKVPYAVAKAMEEKAAAEAVAKKLKEKSDAAASNGGDAASKPVVAKVVPEKAAKEPKAKKAAAVKKLPKPLLIIIPAIAIITVVAIVLAVVLKDNKPKHKGETTTTDTRLVVVTDENGVVVTDADGIPVTLTPETEVVKVTDENGETVTDAKGNPMTTVVYKEVEVEIDVAVTNKDGEDVTDKKGNTVTTKVQSVQDPNKQDGNLLLGSTAVAVTDGQGQTKLDPNGNPYTTVVDITNSNVVVEPAELMWKSSMGGTQVDYFSSVASLSDGGFIATNVTNSKDGNMADFKEIGYKIPYTVLCKYDDEGNVRWRTAIGSNKGLTVLEDLVVGEDGCIYAVGYGKDVGGVKGKGYYDAAIYKFDKNGNEIWHKTFGTSTVDLFNSITACDDGGVVVVGSVGNNNGDAAGYDKPANKSAACIVKYDKDGNVQWKNIVGGNADSFKGVAENANGNIFCVGNFASGELFPAAGKTDSAVVKFDANGKYVGVAPIAGTGNENFTGITACKDGGVVVVGRSNSNDQGSAESMFTGELGSRGGYDAYIMKFKDNLDIIFANPFRGQNDDDLVSVVEKEDGSFIAAGCSNSSTRDLKGITTRGGDDIVIASFDKHGNLSWARSFGGTRNESAREVCLAKDGGYLVCGRTLSNNIDMNGIAQYVNGKDVGVLARFPE